MKKEPTQKDLTGFGLIWAGIFIVIGIYPLINERSLDFAELILNNESKVAALTTSVLFLLISIIYPKALGFFYTIWIKIGEIIGGIVSKIILVFLFYFIFTPIAILMRLLGKNLLNKKLNKNAGSYWIDRKDQPHSLKNQF